MITVRKVLNAYKKTGLVPIQHKFLAKKKGKWCGCLVAALYCAKNNVDLNELGKSTAKRDALINKIVAYSDTKVDDDVIYGFDGFQAFNETESFKCGRESAVKLGLINGNN